MLRRLVGAMIAVLLGLSVSACDSLPKNLERQAEVLDDEITKLDELTVTRESEYAKAQKAPSWSFYAPYAKREEWSKKFVTARAETKRLRETYNGLIDPILDRDESKEAALLRTELTKMNQRYANAKRQVNYVHDRMVLIATGRRNAATWHRQALASSAKIDKTVSAVQPVLQKAKANFPQRASDIDKRFLPLRGLQEGATRARQIVEAEYAKHVAGTGPDYAAFADAYTLIQRNAKVAVAENVRYRAQLASLSREYSLILRDMKMEYWVKPQQETWCDYTDCWENTNTFDFVPVSKTVFESIENAEEISDDVVRSFGLNPDNDQDGYSRGGRTWYIADSEIRYFHKYAEVTGKTVTERPFEEVDEEDFGRHVNDFGMAIATKKLGQFEDEVIDEATPPGMEMVGDPRYGNWVPDGNGGQRWSFLEMYAVYALLTGNNGIYSRNDYDSYRRWREERDRGAGVYGWYGANRSAPLYGSAGSRTRSSSSYRNSPFAKVGGVTAVPRDVRQAGGNARSRGPGSRGK